MSSILPEGVSLAAREKGYSVADKSRGFFFNVEPIEIVDFFDIGTRHPLSLCNSGSAI